MLLFCSDYSTSKVKSVLNLTGSTQYYELKVDMLENSAYHVFTHTPHYIRIRGDEGVGIWGINYTNSISVKHTYTELYFSIIKFINREYIYNIF